MDPQQETTGELNVEKCETKEIQVDKRDDCDDENRQKSNFNAEQNCEDQTRKQETEDV